MATSDPGPRQIARMARAAGATLAGLVRLDALRDQGALPSRWPPTRQFPVRSVLVLALAHPSARPRLDWWGGPGGTQGNRDLIRVVGQLRRRLEQVHGIRSQDLPYGVERGGVRLKDAAVLAGLGIIGRNNLLLTPSHGPRIRLRAMATDLALPKSIPTSCLSWPHRTSHTVADPPWPPDRGAPCAGCAAPCLSACPQEAFAAGTYDRTRCERQMAWDEAHPVSLRRPDDTGQAGPRVAYCRACELACPLGRSAEPTPEGVG